MRGLNVGCGPFKARGWTNTDVDPGMNPEWISKDTWDQPTALDAGHEHAGWERIYCGHVLEHIPWKDVPEFLTVLWDRLAVGGEIMVVGPDVFRTMRLWHEGHPQIAWEKMRAVMEDHRHHQGARVDLAYEGLRHLWNSYGSRIVDAFDDAGISATLIVGEDTPTGDASTALHRATSDGWPLVSEMPDQCAVYALKA